MDPKLVLDEIEKQKILSDQVAEVVLGALMGIYYPHQAVEEIHCGEIGSYGRGTNNDPVPDIDVMFLGIPTDPQKGFVNWIGKGTFEITHSWQGFTKLLSVQEFDPKLGLAISETRKQIEQYFGCKGQSKFGFARSWDVFPGVVFNVSAPIPGYGELEFDINLYHEKEYFGLEHTKRFHQYIIQVCLEFGADIAAKTILEIRKTKQLAKTFAKDQETGQINKAKKVWGVTIEALFTYSYPPQTREGIAEKLSEFDKETFPAVLPETDYTYPIQVVDEGLLLKNVLDAGWETGLFHSQNWEILIRSFAQNN